MLLLVVCSELVSGHKAEALPLGITCHPQLNRFLRDTGGTDGLSRQGAACGAVVHPPVPAAGQTLPAGCAGCKGTVRHQCAETPGTPSQVYKRGWTGCHLSATEMPFT